MKDVSNSFFSPKSIKEYRNSSATPMKYSASYATKTSTSKYKQIINATNLKTSQKEFIKIVSS
jgi:hypothetical protein